MSNMLTHEQLETLTAHLLRCPAVVSKALTSLVPEDFDDATELGPRVLWAISSTFFKEHRRCPPLFYVVEQLSVAAKTVPQLSDPHIFASLAWDVDRMFKIPEVDLLPTYAIPILNTFLFERRIKAPVVAALSTQSFTQASVDEIYRKSQSVSLSSTPVIEPFSDEDMFGASPRIRTNILFLDTLMAGGFRRKEAYGFMAPSGGGKTTFSNQIAIAMAKHQEHVYVFTYEETVTPEYMVPIYACAAGIRRDVIAAAKSYLDFAPDEQARFLAAKEQIGKYLHLVDMSGARSGGSGGAAEIESILAEQQQKGIIVSGFILDWFWPMLQRYIAVHPPARRNAEDRNLAQNELDRLKQLVARLNCWGWINQQVAPAVAGKKAKIQQQDAAEIKSFSWYLNGCLGLNALSEDGNSAELNYSKSRSSRRGSNKIELKGDYATFVPVGDDYVFDPRTGEKVRRVDVNKVPTEKKPKPKTGLDFNYEAVSQ
jgi:hypothetical protein